jgi:hypothetical protein
MRVQDIEHLAKKKEGTKKTVFNPTNKDFSWKYNGESYTIPKGEGVEHDLVVAKHLAKHLVNYILTESQIRTDDKKERNKCLKTVLI